MPFGRTLDPESHITDSDCVHRLCASLAVLLSPCLVGIRRTHLILALLGDTATVSSLARLARNGQNAHQMVNISAATATFGMLFQT